MKSPITLLICIFFSFYPEIGFSQDCTILKNNTFSYRAAKEQVLIEFKGDQYTEYRHEKKSYIRSKIEWISDCEYNLIIQESNLPNFPFDKGVKMHVVVTKVKGKRVYYTSTIEGRSWNGKMKKVKD